MLVESEDHLDVVESSPDLICTHDLEGRILSVNAAACRVLDTPAETLCSMSIQDLLAPSQREGFAVYLQTMKSKGTAAGRMVLATKDGSRRVWEYRNTLRTEGVDSPIVRGVARDITESDDVLNAVRRSEEHFRSIIENASDIIAIIERDGRLRYYSPSVRAVLGHAPDVLIGTLFADLVHQSDQHALSKFLERQISQAAITQTIELRLQHQNGTWRSFEIVAKNLIEKNRGSAIVVNARDITERKHLEAQLAQANRITGLGNLAATVAHEFNNVLMGMLPFAELLQRPDVSQAMVGKGASHIVNSIERGKRIALDILRYTRPAEPDTQPLDLGKWWEKFVREAEAMLGNTIDLVCNIPAQGMCVLADNGQLSQALSNLIANARDALNGGGTITIQANELAANAVFPFGVVPHPEKFIELSVTDGGSGIAPEIVDHIFEPLFTTKRNGGTGLGLAVAHQVLASHHGHIFVESEVGIGTTFHLFLPIATSAPVESSETAQANRQPRAKRLMMIEDEPLIVDGIRQLLSFEGIEVEAVDCGSEAVAAVARFRPDIVLLDFGLPDMDGVEVYSRIRMAEPSLPVIFATGHGDLRLIQEGLGDSRTRFLQKPFEMAALMDVIAELD
jgi:PAS domain S-box-containing protein